MLHWERSQSLGANEGPAHSVEKQKEDTEHKGGREGSRKRAALPQAGYCAPLRGILNFNASKAFHKKLHTFLPPTKYCPVEMNTQADLQEDNSANTDYVCSTRASRSDATVPKIKA